MSQSNQLETVFRNCVRNWISHGCNVNVDRNSCMTSIKITTTTTTTTTTAKTAKMHEQAMNQCMCGHLGKLTQVFALEHNACMHSFIYLPWQRNWPSGVFGLRNLAAKSTHRSSNSNCCEWQRPCVSVCMCARLKNSKNLSDKWWAVWMKDRVNNYLQFARLINYF